MRKALDSITQRHLRRNWRETVGLRGRLPGAATAPRASCPCPSAAGTQPEYHSSGAGLALPSFFAASAAEQTRASPARTNRLTPVPSVPRRNRSTRFTCDHDSFRVSGCPHHERSVLPLPPSLLRRSRCGKFWRHRFESLLMVPHSWRRLFLQSAAGSGHSTRRMAEGRETLIHGRTGSTVSDSVRLGFHRRVC